MADATTRTRTSRLIGGLSFGYLQTAIVALVGLWLTPFLLRHLGQHEYGLWLLAAQVLLYLGLMDLGVVALLPRDVAYASGLDQDRERRLHELIGRATRIVLWQTPMVTMAGIAVWLLMPAEWEALGWPLVVVVLAFVATFPFRIFHAVLQGLQDLSFVGATQLIAWGAGTLATVIGVILGFGLYSLAVGWVLVQVLLAAIYWLRLKASFAGVLPPRIPSLTTAIFKEQVGRGVWISVAQIAQALLYGTDLLVIGKLLGPEVVVPYACTAKLVTLLGNQPQMFMQTALPALSELRASAPRQRLIDVSTSMTQLMLLGSGAVVCVVAVVNEPFVTWWVGASRYGGMTLTMLFAAGMLFRHWNATATYTLFCFGYERRLALTSIGEGLAALALMLLLVPVMGFAGAALGTLIATCVVGLPCNLRALVREYGTPLAVILKPLRASFMRFILILVGVVVLQSYVSVQGFWSAVAAAAVVCTAYGLLMWPMLFAPPLGPMVIHQLRPLVPFVPGLARRLASESST